MEHKGIQFTVVQTANPTGFKWTVELGANKTRTGVSFSKGNAIFKAVRAIEQALDMRSKPA